jgi:hypothetical protein
MNGDAHDLYPQAKAGLALIMLLAIGFHASRRKGPSIGLTAMPLVLAVFVAYGQFVIVPL